ncbi:hypothetical protein B484DRAFT_351778 [Ochromonadaceae sp. CCMP2298]|nr:hypothetical protein B484DRAFT_351778 [Ochromonadaceae sp. CCMP2298]
MDLGGGTAQGTRIRQPHVSVFCHVCSGSGRAELNRMSGEYECERCRSEAVEIVDQGVDEFYSASSETAGTNTAEEEGSVRTETDQLIQQILDRILSVGPGQTNTGSPSLFSVIRDAAADSGRPVGIIVRQPGSSAILQAGGTVQSTESSTNTTGMNRSIFNLISSFRPQSLPLYGGGGGDEMGQSQLEEFLHHILVSAPANGGAPPAAKQLLDSLPRIEIVEGMDTAALGECCITQELFEAGDTMVPLPCGHNYKQEAILHWLEMHNACPVCRLEVK